MDRTGVMTRRVADVSLVIPLGAVLLDTKRECDEELSDGGRKTRSAGPRWPRFHFANAISVRFEL